MGEIINVLEVKKKKEKGILSRRRKTCQLIFHDPLFQMSIFIEGFETYVEKYFKGGSLSFIEKLAEQLSSFRFIRSIPTTIKEKIRSLAESFLMKFPDPLVNSFSILF